jgi:hypothetical protein
VPFNQLDCPQQRAVINGKNGWGGVRGFFDWFDTKNTNCTFGRFFQVSWLHGVRLRWQPPAPEARDVRVGDRTLPEVSALSIKDAAAFSRG